MGSNDAIKFLIGLPHTGSLTVDLRVAARQGRTRGLATSYRGSSDRYACAPGRYPVTGSNPIHLEFK